jgi:lipopolysaccharide/colanic/teichoic acid biosynthesis glycosyltransferase
LDSLDPPSEARLSLSSSIGSPCGAAIKRAMDIVVASVAVVVLCPLMLAAGAAVWLESGSPVIFRQYRVGRGGRPFRILKFRTMRSGAGLQWARSGDPRITRLGAFLRRTSIDELPQLLNVLRGEMSIVGPRPEMVEFAETFSRTVPRYNERHAMRPGITGLAQVSMKRVLEPSDAPEVLRFDLVYVEHWSPFLDVFIIVKTAAEVLFHRVV